MKVMAMLLAIVWFANCAAFAQDSNPDAELDAWREALQQYTADRELWQAHFEEATQPMSTAKKILMGVAYVGDKAATGFVNYYSSRAAIRSEMGRFDARFRSVEGNILEATGSLAEGQGNILAGQGNILAGQDNILAGQDNILEGLSGNEAGLDVLLHDRLPPCATPFGPTGQEPCR